MACIGKLAYPCRKFPEIRMETFFRITARSGSLARRFEVLHPFSSVVKADLLEAILKLYRHRSPAAMVRSRWPVSNTERRAANTGNCWPAGDIVPDFVHLYAPPNIPHNRLYFSEIRLTERRLYIHTKLCLRIHLRRSQLKEKRPHRVEKTPPPPSPPPPEPRDTYDGMSEEPTEQVNYSSSCRDENARCLDLWKRQERVSWRYGQNKVMSGRRDKLPDASKTATLDTQFKLTLREVSADPNC